MPSITGIGRAARLLVGVALGLILTESGHAADEIHWTITGQTSVTFHWRGSADTIRFGLSPAYDLAVQAQAPLPYPFSSPGPFWEARLTGLDEDALYHYSIDNGPDHTFRTPPPRGTSDFVVYALGDVGSSIAYSTVAGVQTLVAQGSPDFVLALGDLTYGNSHGQPAVDRHFNDVMTWSQDAAYMPAWGNHEWDSPATDDLRNYKGRFDLPNAQTSPGSPAVSCCGEDWYWFDYGNARFISYPEPWSEALADWFARASAIMAAAQADPALHYIVTFGHRPAYTSGNYSPGNLTLRGHLDSLGARHSKYVLNLTGHDHNYQRSHPQFGVVHVTAGIGGSGLSPFRDNPAWLAARAIHRGALRLRFTNAGIEGSAMCGPAGSGDNLSCTAGSVIDAFVIASPVLDAQGPEEPSTSPMPSGVSLSARVVPNPSGRNGTLLFETRQPGPARVELFDATGRCVQVLLDSPAVQAGRHSVDIVRSGGDTARPGVYFYRVRVGDASVSGRLLIVE